MICTVRQCFSTSVAGEFWELTLAHLKVTEVVKCSCNLNTESL